MRNFRLAAAWIVAIGALLSAKGAYAQQNDVKPQPLVREIFVPYEQLDKLLEAQARRVYLTRKEYAQLLKDAIKQAPHEPPR